MNFQLTITKTGMAVQLNEARFSVSFKNLIILSSVNEQLYWGWSLKRGVTIPKKVS
jgi:hypothetical protein